MRYEEIDCIQEQTIIEFRIIKIKGPCNESSTTACYRPEPMIHSLWSIINSLDDWVEVFSDTEDI